MHRKGHETYSDVEVGGDDLAGLAHLVLVGSVAGINCRKKKRERERKMQKWSQGGFECT